MEFVTLSSEWLIFLFCVAVIAGFLDTLAGGGGLITLPALLMSGLAPLEVLGTNKLQGSMGTATATSLLLKKRKIHWADIRGLMLFAFIGATLGAIAVQFVNTEALTLLIPFVLLGIAIYFIISPQPSQIEQTPQLALPLYQRLIIPSIGAYDGAFGPGTGSFFALAGVSCRGLGLIKATATAKPLNFATNLASLLVFIFAGQIAWLVGLIMMGGQFIGAWLGTHSLFHIPVSLLRALVVVMCLAMLIKTVWF